MPATSCRSSVPRSTRSRRSRSAFGCGSAARTVPTRRSSARNWSIVIIPAPPSRASPSPPAPAARTARAAPPGPRPRACPSGGPSPPRGWRRAPAASAAPTAPAPRRRRRRLRCAPAGTGGPRRTARRSGSAGGRRRRGRGWQSFGVELCELAGEALAERAVRLGGRGGDGGPGGPRAPAPDRQRERERAQRDGGERRDPREPVEAVERGRRQHLLAVAGPERVEDRLLRLPGRETLGDLLLHRLARAALEVVAGVDREAAAALAGERLLDLLLRGGERGRRRGEQQGHGEERRRPHAQSAVTRTPPSA